MYPLTCAGGYPVPIAKGKFKVVGFVATVSDPTAASRVTFIDSDANTPLLDSQALKGVLADLKGLANADGVLGAFFDEPIHVRDGITISNLTNVV